MNYSVKAGSLDITDRQYVFDFGAVIEVEFSDGVANIGFYDSENGFDYTHMSKKGFGWAKKIHYAIEKVLVIENLNNFTFSTLCEKRERIYNSILTRMKYSVELVSIDDSELESVQKNFKAIFRG